MQTVERTIGDVTILDLKGRLVAEDGEDEFRDAVDRLVRIGRRNVLLNMDEVPSLDSCGLGVMVSKLVTLRRLDGDLRLCNLQPRASKVLGLTKLLTIFEAFTSEADGVRSFTRES